MPIELQIAKSEFCPSLFPLLLDYSHRFEGYKGSAGSGKSYFITQKIIIRCCQEPIKVMVCRRYGTTIRNTVFSLFKEILTKWQIINYVKIRESDFNIQFPNGSEIIFIGLDEETKLLSLNNISTIFVEEAFEIPKEIFEQLNLRMRGKAQNQQILFAFNPISKNHWLYDFCVSNPPSSFIFSETTYKDNPYLSQEYITGIEDLKTRNPAKFRIYGLGEWGSDPEGLVFSNWHREVFDPSQLVALGYEHRVGADLGFMDPTTVIASLWDRNNKTIYVYDEFYKTGCQLDQVYQSIVNMGLSKSTIYFDSAEPRSIDYFKKQGVNAKPCIKGQDSVQARIAFLQNHTLIIHPKCINLIRELENFSYEKDKKTGKYTDDTTHEFSHAIDGLGYAYSDIYTKGRIRTLDKSVLGL